MILYGCMSVVWCGCLLLNENVLLLWLILMSLLGWGS